MNVQARYLSPTTAVALFKTKHVNGLTEDELGMLLSQYPTVNEQRFYDALTEATFVIDGEPIYTFDDVAYAITSAVYVSLIDEDYEPL